MSYCHDRLLAALLVGLGLMCPVRADEPGQLGHWKLTGDAQDASGRGHDATNHGADLAATAPDGRAGKAARFDGRKAYLEVGPRKSLKLGRGEFALAAWVHTDEKLDDALGDIASQYDPVTRRGWSLCLKNGAGATNSQANFRNLHFAIDDGHAEPQWTDCGRPGNAVYVMAQAVHDDQLFVGTCEPGQRQAGHAFRYGGGTRWIDCGSPDRSNAVTSLASHGGKLYAGTGKYRLAGSSLPESPNAILGGKVYRYEADGKWTDCGQLPRTEAVGGMVVFRGELYASSLYKPAGFYRYRGQREWEALPLPSEDRRVVAMCPFNGHLYAASYDGCYVFRFDGRAWEEVGKLEPSGQTYSFEVVQGKLHVGTWPNGKVFRFDDEGRWSDVGRLGEEKEVMGMALYNGKLYAGTLPLAEVYRFDGDGRWLRIGRVDHTPDVRYRRAWSMAVYQGRLFCGALPSGHVHALEVGKCATCDRALRPGWRHVAAQRVGDVLQLYVDGRRVAQSTAGAASLDVSNDRPLWIGSGPHDHFRGSLSDVRLYGRALSAEEIAALAARP
jgi:hypothetical protein